VRITSTGCQKRSDFWIGSFGRSVYHSCTSAILQHSPHIKLGYRSLAWVVVATPHNAEGRLIARADLLKSPCLICASLQTLGCPDRKLPQCWGLGSLLKYAAWFGRFENLVSGFRLTLDAPLRLSGPQISPVCSSSSIVEEFLHPSSVFYNTSFFVSRCSIFVEFIGSDAASALIMLQSACQSSAAP